MLEISPRASFAVFPASFDPMPPERRCWPIVAYVASDFGVNSADITCAARGSQKAAFARQVAIYLARVGFGYSFAAIGECFRRDRTTVAHACRVVEEKRDDIRFDCRMAALELAFRAADGDMR